MRSLNLAFVVASLTAVLATTALAQSDQEVYAEADRIFAQAEETVSENLANFIKANEKPFATARHEMAELISRLNKEGRSQLATSLQKRLNGLEETVQRKASVKVPVVAKQNDLPQHEGWYVLFRSADPKVWDSEANAKDSFAVPLSNAPAGIRYLRVRRQNDEVVIIPMTNASIVRDGLVTKNLGWAGDNDRAWDGNHLGIYDARTQPKIGEVIQDEAGHLGWGFGHIHGPAGQGWAWDRKAIPQTVFEISVKCSDLTADEKKALLAD